MGSNAVWISPVTKQVEPECRGFGGYAATDNFALNSYFGTESDLKALATALHDRGMVSSCFERTLVFHC